MKREPEQSFPNAAVPTPTIVPSSWKVLRTVELFLQHKEAHCCPPRGVLGGAGGDSGEDAATV